MFPHSGCGFFPSSCRVCFHYFGCYIVGQHPLIVSNFLTTMLNDRDLKYSTLNLHRSVISAYHPPIEGFQVGQHPLIVRLLKGAFNKKPPQPRYTQTWDVNQVLEEIKRLGPNESLTLKALSLKLAMLLALTTVSRSSRVA